MNKITRIRTKIKQTERCQKKKKIGQEIAHNELVNCNNEKFTIQYHKYEGYVQSVEMNENQLIRQFNEANLNKEDNIN